MTDSYVKKLAGDMYKSLEAALIAGIIRDYKGKTDFRPEEYFTPDNLKKVMRAAGAPPKSRAALSAWIVFCQAKRKDVVRKNPDLKLGDVTKELSKLWKALNPSDKKKWQQKADVANKKRTPATPDCIDTSLAQLDALQ